MDLRTFLQSSALGALAIAGSVRAGDKTRFPGTLTINGDRVDASVLRFAGNGRDTRMHTLAMNPYLEYEIALKPDQLVKGENVLEVTPLQLILDFTGKINLSEVELTIRY